MRFLLLIFTFIGGSSQQGIFNKLTSLGSNVLNENVPHIAPYYNFVLGPTNPPTSSYHVWNNLPPNYEQNQGQYGSFTETPQITCSGDSLIGKTTVATCTRNGVEISCSNQHLPGDLAFIRCKTGYTTPSHHLIKSDLECLSSGRWSSPIYECVASCGRITKKAKPLIVDGYDAEVSDFPWNVAIYKLEILICGGNIISERVILSAAHCFVAETSTGTEKIAENMFEIIAGKYRRDYKAIEEDLQRFKPERIKIHHAYNGYSGNYDADLAIVTLDRQIEFKYHISPVCLDLDLKTLAEKQPPAAGKMGVIAGYGFTEFDGKPSETLKRIELPIVNFQTCKQKAPENFMPFLTSDKFCAGYDDGRGGVCKGDSGAGLSVPKMINNENIYYIHGIVSNTRSVEGGCDMYFYAMFTHIQNYIDMIKEEIRLSNTL